MYRVLIFHVRSYANGVSRDATKFINPGGSRRVCVAPATAKRAFHEDTKLLMSIPRQATRLRSVPRFASKEIPFFFTVFVFSLLRSRMGFQFRGCLLGFGITIEFHVGSTASLLRV